MDASYTGFYTRFDTVSKSEAAVLTGPDNLVGDDYSVVFKTDDDKVVAWLQNKFGKLVGFLDAEASRKLQLANARDLKIRAILSFVAFSDEPEPGMYWGQVALFCYNPAYEKEIDAFIDRVASSIAEGIRPDINLGSQAVNRIFEEADFLPSKHIPLPEKKTGTAILKDRRSFSEKMIEQGRARNKGCYLVSWLFIILVIAAVIYGLHLLGLF